MDSRTVPSERTVREEIIRGVAAARDADPLELDPLYDAIDPDAVGALVERGFAGRIEFRYAGCLVSVSGDGDVDVTTTGRDVPSSVRNRDSE